jgi:hypothetical protein
MKALLRLLAIGTLGLTAGCAHMINLTPPLNTLEADGITKVGKTAGYYIDPALRSKVVTTPGGGGDKVSYTPYADSEPALRDVLVRVFGDAVPVASLTDKQALADKHVAYVLIPTITTTSSSSSALTWPPTNFTVTIDCKVQTPDGTAVWQGTAKGSGDAVFADFKHDFSLAARRASKAAFLDLQSQLNSAPAFR